MRTQINWMLNNYCTSECTYCPTKLRGGESPKGILEYIEVTQQLIDHYTSLGRKIDWIFNGGEPLDMFDFPMMLKLCKENGGTIDLTTNGGKLWLDWWAIAPHIDSLHLSYHYWQNPNLIKFIIQAFQKSNKHIDIGVPIRPDYFDQDMQRALEIETEFNIVVSKNVLYNEADQSAGMFPYTEKQLRVMRGEIIVEEPIIEETTIEEIIVENSVIADPIIEFEKPVFKEKRIKITPIYVPNKLVEEQQYFKNTTFQERYENKIAENPVYTGMLCNVGIEKLTISHLGWVSGSSCNDKPLGNIWRNNGIPISDAETEQNILNKLGLPTTPHVCGMRACMHISDQLITKFPQTGT
jgi:organic radical activating enzyme